MNQTGKFILMTLAEFGIWLNKLKCTRTIKLIQQHHTYIPAYKHFKGNHFQMCASIETSHEARGFEQIAQNLTIFPDGMIMVCRDVNIAPAGIKGANEHGICIEIIGNFDVGGDLMNTNQKQSVLGVNALLCKRFKLIPSTDTLVYHHWYDLTSGERINDNSKGHSTKSCPGTAFFGGNSIEAAKKNFVPAVVQALKNPK